MGCRIGLDWGAASRAVCVIDAAHGGGAARFEVAHTAAGLAALTGRLATFGDPADLPIAIERPSGLVVEALIEAGHPVVPIHPNVLKASRPRYRAAGGRSDLGDAYLLADPLRSLLESFRPGAAALFAAIASPIALAFLLRYPTPDGAARLGEKRLAAFLAQHRYCGRRAPAELLARLRAAPTGLAGDAEADAKGELARARAAALDGLVTQSAGLTSRIQHAVAALPDGQIVVSFPRAGQICAAPILAELGDVRARCLTADQLAAEAGLGPVTHRSGKSRGVVFRRACNRRLRQAITSFADNSRHSSAWAAAIYRRARARGCRHPHAIRILGRAWVRVLGRAWTGRQPYDPDRHLGANTSTA